MSSVEYAALVLSRAPRELRVIECLGSGLRNDVIARHMGRSPKTVKSHLRDLTRRTGMTRLSLAVMGYRLLVQY
jgi:DNA-binding CsgD family transcriptional regulator